MQLADEALINQVITPTAGAAGLSAINSSIIDMTQGDGALFVVCMGAITATAVTSIKLQHGDAPALGDAADILGTNQTIAVADAEKIFYVDLSRPVKRYVRLVVTRGTANAVVSSALALIYNAKNQPVTHPTATVNGEIHVGELSGTA